MQLLTYSLKKFKNNGIKKHLGIKKKQKKLIRSAKTQKTKFSAINLIFKKCFRIQLLK